MKLAVVQVRGVLNINRNFKDTLKSLKLIKKNSCVLVDNTPERIGMLARLKDYITWGEADKETVKLLFEKRGKIVGNNPLTEKYLKDNAKAGFDEFINNFIEGKVKLKEVPGLKPFFRLTPPRGGFEREGIKKPFSLGGSLGYRGKEINNLVRKML